MTETPSAGDRIPVNPELPDIKVSAGPPPRLAALATAVTELERHVARNGWDGPIRMFALIRTAKAITINPDLGEQLPPEVVAAARSDESHVTSIEQEGLPRASTLDDMLAQISWPDSVDGAAIVVERLVVPPEVEDELPADPAAALSYLREHPKRQDVRIAAGVMRDGSSWCALRTRAHDDDASVGGGENLVPGLVDALRATLD